jgi:steroid delta-isomerase-like uncharacterized protein
MSPEENKAIVRRWFAEIDKGNPVIVEELCAPDYVDHNPPVPGVAAGNQGVREANATLRASFPDTVHLIQDQVAEGDTVVTRLIGRGTFRADYLGIPANGKVIEIPGISIHRLAGGKLVEHWAQVDGLSFLQQLDAIPPLGQPADPTP